MENKLIELKNEYCKYRCPQKDIRYSLHCDSENCKYCDKQNVCDEGDVDPCKLCQVNEYIKYIRDEI